MNLRNINKKESRTISVTIVGKKNIPNQKDQIKFKALEEGTFMQET